MGQTALINISKSTSNNFKRFSIVWIPCEPNTLLTIVLHNAEIHTIKYIITYVKICFISYGMDLWIRNEMKNVLTISYVSYEKQDDF